MICCVSKTVQISYSAPVSNCVRRLRIAPPKSRGAQTVRSFRWNCQPAPDSSREYRDEFGNSILELCHARIGNKLRVEAHIESENSDVTFGAPREVALPESGIGAFLLPSSLCDASEELRILAAAWKGMASSAEARAEDINVFVHHACEYSPNTTTLETRASQVLQWKRGVCQDFAHLFIALCRLSGLPARYVGGYIEGDGAMHAWAEVLCGERWLAFDPTHGTRATRCLAVATGRDYRDAAPHIGEYSGRAISAYQAHCVVKCEDEHRILLNDKR
jgi:transglutaminase-like putative cysteine protease